MLTQPLRRFHRKPHQSIPTINLLCAALSSAALTAAAQTAAAADMPVKAPAAPVYNWTGCYAGINGGGAASGSDFHSNVDPGTHFTDPGDVGPDGTVATAQQFV
jgi:outer membrane immunogenic protein